MTRRKPINHGKARTCRYGAWCAVCLQGIEPGQRYYDRGGMRRAHIDCGNAAEMKPELEHPASVVLESQEAHCRKRARDVVRHGSWQVTVIEEDLL